MEAAGLVRMKSASTRFKPTRGLLLIKCTPSLGTIDEAACGLAVRILAISKHSVTIHANDMSEVSTHKIIIS